MLVQQFLKMGMLLLLVLEGVLLLTRLFHSILLNTVKPIPQKFVLPVLVAQDL
jgi:hypothetical protein